MKTIFFIFALFAFIRPSFSQQQDNTEEFLSSFVQGSYEIIGRWPESDSLYAGQGIIRSEKGQLQVIRIFKGQTINAKARIEKAAMAETWVLRAQFSVNGVIYEATYLIHGDLDNYARLSGYIYRKGKHTKKPGLEAWFIKIE